jgi:hypothetical protein
MRRWVLGSVGAGALLFSPAVMADRQPAMTGGADAWSAFRGRVVFSDVLIAPPEDFASAASMVAALRRLDQSVVGANDGFWRFHFVAFLSPAPAADVVRIVATDVTQPKRPRQVKVFEMAFHAGDHELRVNDFVLTEVMGFEHGHHYEIAVTRSELEEPLAEPDGRKQDVCARGVVTLR